MINKTPLLSLRQLQLMIVSCLTNIPGQSFFHNLVPVCGLHKKAVHFINLQLL